MTQEEIFFFSVSDDVGKYDQNNWIYDLASCVTQESGPPSIKLK